MLSAFLNNTVLVQAPSGSVDASGAPVAGPFVTKSTLSAAIWPMGGGNRPTRFGQLMLSGSHAVVFTSDPGVRAGWRMVATDSKTGTSITLTVQGPALLYSGGANSVGPMYLVDAEELKAS